MVIIWEKLGMPGDRKQSSDRLVDNTIYFPMHTFTYYEKFIFFSFWVFVFFLAAPLMSETS